MIKPLLCCVVASVFFAFPAMADETPIASGGSTSAPAGDHDLGKVHGGLTAEGARSAGQSRDVAVSATNPRAATPMRPTASPRTVRRLGVERALAAIDPKVRACASENSTSSAVSIPMRVSIAPNGDVEQSESASSSRVAPSLVACVVAAVSTAHFGPAGSAGAMIVVPLSVPNATKPVTPPATP